MPYKFRIYSSSKRQSVHVLSTFCIAELLFGLVQHENWEELKVASSKGSGKPVFLSLSTRNWLYKFGGTGKSNRIKRSENAKLVRWLEKYPALKLHLTVVEYLNKSCLKLFWVIGWVVANSYKWERITNFGSETK